MRLFGIVHKRLMAFLMALVMLAAVASRTIAVQALVVNESPQAKVSFTFDDGLISTLNNAAPTLAKHGLVGTDYVVTDCASKLSSCPADIGRANAMTWTQVLQLQNSFGWEIGSHTVSHKRLSTLSQAQKESQLAQSKAALASHGINATSFASPQGDYDAKSLALIAKYYQSHRVFREAGNNNWPYSDFLLNDMQVQSGVTVDQVKAAVDDAVLNNRWLVLTFHGIKPTPNPDPTFYEYATSDLDAIASYVQSKQSAGQLKAIKMNQGLVSSDSNLLTNGGFDQALSNGWTTNNSTAFSLDVNNNGSLPGSKNSVKITAAPTNAYLFSSKAAVDPNASYMFKSFLNVTALAAGEVNFYVDEYDANGTWISGQFKKAERSVFAEEMNFAYKPTSAQVASASLQIGVTGGSGIKGYIDSIQMFATTAANPVPPSAPTNLVANGTFDAGIATGWTTNSPTTIVADGASHGSPANPINSVSITATAIDRHLFGPNVAVSSAKSYTLVNYTNVTALTSGELGFYIDEYDAAGNWISGQYKGGVRSVTAGDTTIAYTPSSAAVASASLQVIAVGNSGLKAYFDDARWYQN